MTPTPSTSAAGGSGYAGGPATHPPEWHWLVACDVLLNNLATGLFLVAATAELLRPATFRPVSAWAYPVSLAFLGLDLLCLVLDLGDPLRFHHMLRVFKPTSPMSLGTWSLTAFSFPLGAVVALQALVAFGLVRGHAGWVRWAHVLAVLAAIVPAFASAAYKGVLFSTTAQPGWRDARWLGGYLVSSAVMLGCAALLVLATIAGVPRASDALRVPLAVLIACHALPFGLLVADLYPTLIRSYSSARTRGAAAALLIGGYAAPIVLLLAGSGRARAWGAFVLIVLTSLIVRAILVWLPHRFART